MLVERLEDLNLIINNLKGYLYVSGPKGGRLVPLKPMGTLSNVGKSGTVYNILNKMAVVSNRDEVVPEPKESSPDMGMLLKVV